MKKKISKKEKRYRYVPDDYHMKMCQLTAYDLNINLLKKSRDLEKY